MYIELDYELDYVGIINGKRLPQGTNSGSWATTTGLFLPQGHWTDRDQVLAGHTNWPLAVAGRLSRRLGRQWEAYCLF